MGGDLERAVALMDVGRWEDALVHLGRAVAADPNDDIAQVQRCVCLLNLDRPADALEAAGSALAIDPTYGDAHRLRSRALMDLDAPADDVLDAARLAVEYQPWESAAWLQHIRALLGANRHSDAADLLAQMRTEFPNEMDTEIAAALVELSRPDIILRIAMATPKPLYWAVMMLLVLSGGAAVVLLLLGARRLMMARTARRAETSVIRALEHDPESYHLRSLLADLYEQQGRSGRSLATRVELARTDPQPEVVAAVTRTIRWQLLGLAAVVSVGAVIAIVVLLSIALEQGTLAWISAPAAVVVAGGAPRIVRVASRPLLARIPEPLARRIVDRLRPWSIAARGLIAITCVLLAVVPYELDGGESPAPLRWTAAAVLVGLAADSAVAMATRQRRTP